MSLPQPDLAILRKAQRGDERAFAIIVRTYETPVYNYVLRLTNGEKALAEDLTQEVFLRVYRTRKRYHPQAKFSTWLFTIANNLALNHLRGKGRNPMVAIRGDDGHQGPRPRGPGGDEGGGKMGRSLG